MTYWVSTERFTVRVETAIARETGWEMIVNTAPLAKRFVGQRLDRFLGWAKKMGGIRIVRLDV